MKSGILISVLIILGSCDGDVPPRYPPKIENPGVQKDTFMLKPESNAVLCGSCPETVLIVEHQECTECKDIYVDSGRVYISYDAMHKIDSAERVRQKEWMSTDSVTKKKVLRFDHLNTHDIQFETEHDFHKLWMNKEEPWFGAKYRVRGQLIYDPGHRFTRPQLVFRMRDHEKLEEKYAEQFD